MANNNNMAMLALVAGGGYLAYKFMSGKGLITPVGVPPATPPAATSGPTSNTSIAPAPTDSTPAPSRSAADPRGVRNNNPGAIAFNAGNTWPGQIGTDGTFAKFDAPVHGLQALFTLLRNYCHLYGACTINTMAAKWAVNNPAAYAAALSSMTGIGLTDVLAITDADKMERLARGIIAVENGPIWYNYYPDSVLSTAFSAAA